MPIIDQRCCRPNFLSPKAGADTQGLHDLEKEGAVDGVLRKLQKDATAQRCS